MTSIPQQLALNAGPPADETADADESTPLDSWAATLSFLDPDVTPGIERLAKRLDLAMGAQHSPVRGTLEPSGYGGIARRGDLTRVLLSDWALADIEPDEFMRRVVSAELSYLELERVEPRPPGQVAVLYDSGPRQTGAPRLAQLAALVVLERRARASGVPLMIGCLGDISTTWHSGALPELFKSWLGSRRPQKPTRANLNAWLDTLTEGTTVWIFGADDLSVARPGVAVERLHAVESTWGPEGATALRVDVSGRTLELDLPDTPTSLRILRGRGIRRASKNIGYRTDAALRFPGFPSSSRRLLARSERDNELISFAIPETQDAPATKPWRRRFRGRVIAASLLGKRTVALVVVNDEVTVEIVGKKLASLERIRCDIGMLDLDHEAIDELCSTGLAPLFFADGKVLVQLGEAWWWLSPQTKPWCDDQVITAVASNAIDQPRVLRHFTDQVRDGRRPMPLVEYGQRTFLGRNGSYITETSTGTWVTEVVQLDVDPEAKVAGLSNLGGMLSLITQSAAGQIIRVHQTSGVRTLTKHSGDIASLSVHPTLPILAIERTNGTIIVVDLETDEVLHRIRVGGST